MGRALRLLPWLVPIGMLAAWQVVPAGLYSELSTAMIPVLIALGALLVASRRPVACLVALFALMPYQVFFPAWLYKIGVPLGIIRPLTGWRELAGLAIMLAAIRTSRRERRPLDTVELVAFAYVALVSAYVLFPRLFAAAAPEETDVRSQAFRASAGFVLLLIACRRAPYGSRARDLADKALRWTAVVVAMLAVWEFIDGDGWNTVVVDTLQVTRYQVEVLQSRPYDFNDVRVYSEIGGVQVVRVSSVMGSPLALGHFLLIPFGLALERSLRGRTKGATAQAVLIGAAILFTQTRSALLGSAVVLMLVLRRSPGRTEAARGRFWLLLVGLSVAAAPFVISAGLFDRFSDEGSNTAHREGFFEGVGVVAGDPLGRGLGTSAGVGQRFFTATSVSENYYLQVGAEAGVLGTVLFVGLVVSVNRGLRRVRDETGDGVVAGVRSGFFGVCVAAFFLHAFNNQTVAWTAFGAAGMALGAIARARDPDRPIGATIDPEQTYPHIDQGSPSHT